MGHGHAHPKITLRCGGRHLGVYDVISRERHDKMACNHDIRESENSREQKFPTFPSCFHFICETLIMTHTLFCSSPLVIDDLPAHNTPYIAIHAIYDKYHKITLDRLSRTSCTHDLLPSGNIARNIINVTSERWFQEQ
jgi:hypothetical protein